MDRAGRVVQHHGGCGACRNLSRRSAVYIESRWDDLAGCEWERRNRSGDDCIDLQPGGPHWVAAVAPLGSCRGPGEAAAAKGQECADGAHPNAGKYEPGVLRLSRGVGLPSECLWRVL